MTPSILFIAAVGANWNTILITSGAILFLLICSGFFSGSETALTAASRARMRTLEREGEEAERRKAGRVMGLIADRERLIGAILLGNNLVNILASALATWLLSKLLGDYGVAAATLVMTLMVLIFAEVLPKTWAISRPDSFAMAVAAPVGVFVRFFAPIVLFVQAIVRGTLKAVGVTIGEDAHVFDLEERAREEIKGTIELHAEAGAMEREERHRLGGVLDLKELTVADVMVHRRNMDTIDAALSPHEIMMHVMESSHTRLPLYKGDQDNVVGVIHVKELLRSVAEHGGEIGKIRPLDIAREPWFVPETTGLLDQLSEFQRRREHFALVVDEYGSLMGLVTLEDVIEEIIGEIEDEHDEQVQGVRQQPDGSVNVDGDVAIRDLNRALDWSLPDDNAVTVAGLVIHEAQAIPEPGQQFYFHGHRFQVLRRKKNQITALRISPPLTVEAGK